MKKTSLLILLFISLVGCQLLSPAASPTVVASPINCSPQIPPIHTATASAQSPRPPEKTATQPAPTPTAPHPTPQPAPELSDIQQTLDLFIQAINENRPELLDQVVDPGNKPFQATGS